MAKFIVTPNWSAMGHAINARNYNDAWDKASDMYPHLKGSKLKKALQIFRIP